MNGTCKLYRHFDANGVLLYVGISKSAMRRLAEHSSSNWADEIANVSVATFPSRAHALDAERAAIQNEKPKFNIAHSKTAFSGPIPRKIGNETMTAAERQALKRARVKAGLVRMELWVPEEKYAALAELLSEYT